MGHRPSPARVIAAKPTAASTAMPALASTIVSRKPDSRPTGRPKPVTARPVVAAANRPSRRPVTRSAPRTMTGAAPMVTRVAAGCQRYGVKSQLWKSAASRPIAVIRVQAARPVGQRLPVTVRNATISTPPVVGRQAATEIADDPATRPSRLPVGQPVYHNSPEITRKRRPVLDRRRAAADTVVNARIGKSLLRREGNGRGSGAHRTSPGQRAHDW